MTTTDFPTRHHDLTRSFKDLHGALPGPMRGFADLHRAALADGALSAKHKELMALAISIAVRCEGCVGFHVHDALRAGASRPEIEEAIGVAILMAGGPGAVYGADAHEALAQFEAERG